MRKRLVLAKALVSRGVECWSVVKRSLAPSTMPTILKVELVVTCKPMADTLCTPETFVHTCTLVTRSPSKAHQRKYAATKASKLERLVATSAMSSAKLVDGTR